MKNESITQQEVQIQAMQYFNCNLMRNNSGAFKDETGRVVFFGLGNTSKKRNDEIKSSDLIGITSVVITPDMVGKTIGVFTAIEVKKEDWNPTKTLDKREIAQKRFIDWVISMGGLAGFANNIDKLPSIFRR